MSSQSKKRPTVIHRIPGRLRIKLLSTLKEQDMQSLLRDLKVSPDVKKATLTRSSLVIEHNDNDQTMTEIGSRLSQIFPDFEPWSTHIDMEMGKYAADPWINKTIPAGLLSLALYRGIKEGAFLAGESAFALAYIAFDIYWKFQQENVIRKIEQGLSRDNGLDGLQ
jgi:hypothetical protein